MCHQVGFGPGSLRCGRHIGCLSFACRVHQFLIWFLVVFRSGESGYWSLSLLSWPSHRSGLPRQHDREHISAIRVNVGSGTTNVYFLRDCWSSRVPHAPKTMKCFVRYPQLIITERCHVSRYSRLNRNAVDVAITTEKQQVIRKMKTISTQHWLAVRMLISLLPLGPKPRVSEMRILRFAISYGGRWRGPREESGVTSNTFCRVSKDVRDPVRIVAQIEFFESQSIAVSDIKSLRSLIAITQVTFCLIPWNVRQSDWDRRRVSVIVVTQRSHVRMIFWKDIMQIIRNLCDLQCHFFCGATLDWNYVARSEWESSEESSVANYPFFSTPRLRITFRYSVLSGFFLSDNG